MTFAKIRVLTSLTIVAAALAALATPAACLELQLAGTSLGDTPEELMASQYFGTPDGIFTPGNIFNSVKLAPGEEMPLWAVAVRMDQIGPDQVQWVYNRDPVAVGIVISGQGINAHVTNIVVSEWRNFKSSNIGQTTKGIRLGSTFSEVLEGYGWPNRLQIISETGTTEAQPRQVGAPSASAPRISGLGGAARRPGRMSFRFGSRDEEEPAATRAPALPRPTVGSWGVRPTVGFGRTAAAPATPRFGASSGLNIGFGRSARAGQSGGLAPLPRVGPAPAGVYAPTPAPTGPSTATQADVGQTPNVTFTQSCIMSYPSVDFLVYRMKVFRIHIYGR